MKKITRLNEVARPLKLGGREERLKKEEKIIKARYKELQESVRRKIKKED